MARQTSVRTLQQQIALAEAQAEAARALGHTHVGGTDDTNIRVTTREGVITTVLTRSCSIDGSSQSSAAKASPSPTKGFPRRVHRLSPMSPGAPGASLQVKSGRAEALALGRTLADQWD